MTRISGYHHSLIIIVGENILLCLPDNLFQLMLTKTKRNITAGTFNNPAGDICLAAQSIGDRIRIVHIKDHADRLGDGDVPIARALRALRDRAYDDSLVFETNPTGDPIRAAEYNLGFVRGILSAQAAD